ncbi:hypothetical protein BH09ACT6_BH09ACT6_08790 [soil metagenome]
MTCEHRPISACSMHAKGAIPAEAVPNCSQVPAPPACHHAPTPPAPAPLPTLQTVAFTPTPGEANRFNVYMDEIPTSAIASYPTGAETPYWMSITCTNGFFYSAPMTALHTDNVGTGSFLEWHKTTGADEASGDCFATTWDRAALGVSHSVVTPSTHPPADRSATYWSIDFSPCVFSGPDSTRN